jgi:hypothetical protein
MKLESVRALKHEIRDRVLSPLMEQDVHRRRLGVRTARLETMPPPKTVALGVSTANAGEKEFRLAVRVQHPLLWQGPEIQSIVQAAQGEADVRYIGSVRPFQGPWYQEPCAPLRIGCSVGHFEITAGTLGAFVKDRASGAVHILSNNHVLAAENQAQLGDDVLQPGKYDHGIDPASAVANLARFIPISFAGPNLVDGAVAQIAPSVNYDPRSLGARGNLSGGRITPLSLYENTYKVGRTTGLTQGKITAIEVENITVTYDKGSALFDEQVEIESANGRPFASDGDSGSLVVDENNLAIGIIFGGTQQLEATNPGLVYVNALDAVLNQLNVDLLW